MSTNKILFRLGLWFFLFVLAGSIIFAYLQGKHPDNLDANIYYSTLLGFISSATIMTFYGYYNQPKAEITSKIEIEIPHGNYSGTISENWLPAGYGIIYENAWQKPTINILSVGKVETTLVDFANGKVVIGGIGNSIEILEPKGNIKIIVRFIDTTKISIGH